MCPVILFYFQSHTYKSLNILLFLLLFIYFILLLVVVFFKLFSLSSYHFMYLTHYKSRVLMTFISFILSDSLSEQECHPVIHQNNK